MAKSEKQVISPGGVFRITMVAPPSTAASLVSRKRVFIYEPLSPWFLFIVYQLKRTVEGGAAVQL
jgi:hypothetical protein